MRCFITALLLLGALIFPKKVEALDCAWMPASWYRPADGVEAPLEKHRQDAEARATLGLLERTPIILRGRIASMRYLSDPGKTNTSLLVFDHVEVLKGRLPKTDRKAYIIKHQWCDGGCNVGMDTLAWPRGETVVIGVQPNHPVDRSKALDPSSDRVIYRGRIDALLGPCGDPRLTPMALELLNAPGEEIARLKREYVPRRPN